MKKLTSGAILRFIDRMERERVCLHGFEIRQGGQVLAEGYYPFFHKGDKHRMYSISKTMTALAVGILAGAGKLSLDDRIADYFQDKLPAQPDPRVLRLTIRDMLRMATCHKKTTYREGIDADWAGTFFTVKPTHEPGTMFNYDTSCSQVLCALCERVSGQGLLAFLQERVFDPIGATDEKAWLTDPSGVPQGGTGLQMSLQDLGKVAQLVADGGRGIVPVDYIAAMTRRQIVNEVPSIPAEAGGYGYQMWMIYDGWAMCGMGGQVAVYDPATQLLLCTIADVRLDALGIQRIYSAFREELVGGCGGTEAPGDAQRLQERLSALHLDCVAHHGGALNDVERTYAMEPNDMGLRRVVLTGGSVRMVWEDGEDVFTWEEPGKSCLIRWPNTDYPAILSAGRTEEGGLQVRCQAIHHAPCGVEMFIHEKNGFADLRLRKSNDPLTARYEGFFWGESEA